jgi:hypothetical protein
MVVNSPFEDSPRRLGWLPTLACGDRRSQLRVNLRRGIEDRGDARVEDDGYNRPFIRDANRLGLARE